MKNLLLILLSIVVVMLMASSVVAQNWDFTNGPYRPHEVKDITSSKVGSVQTIYAADAETLKVTTDGGTTWNNTGSLMLNPLVVASHPTNANIVHVGKMGKLYLSTDGGGTWGTPKIDDANLVPLRLAVSTYNANLWILGADTVKRNSQWTTSVYHSENGGATWTGIDYFRDNAHTNANDAVYHPLTNEVWVGGSKKPLSQTPDNSADDSPPTKGVWYSSNGGTDWTFKPGTGQNLLGGGSIHRNVSALAYSYNAPDDQLLFAAVTWNDNGTVKAKLYQSGDNGSNWGLAADLHAQIGVSQVRAMKVKTTDYNVIIAATNRGFARSTNRGVTWTLPQQPTDLQEAYQVMFDKLDASGNTVWLGSYPTIYKSTN